MEPAETATTSGLPRLNERAPEFTAPTTDGVKSLDDYKGKWLVLFSHPADFTPVCTTEFMAFAKMAPEFNKRNCELLGLSIDSHHSHIAWMRNIKEKFGVEIPFPIIADLKMDVARAYGMIHPGAADTSAVRATFIIDPNGILRAMVYYPMSNGRSTSDSLYLSRVLRPNQHALPKGPADAFLFGFENEMPKLFHNQGGHRSIRSIDRAIQSIDSIDAIMFRLFENF